MISPLFLLAQLLGMYKLPYSLTVDAAQATKGAKLYVYSYAHRYLRDRLSMPEGIHVVYINL